MPGRGQTGKDIRVQVFSAAKGRKSTSEVAEAPLPDTPMLKQAAEHPGPKCGRAGYFLLALVLAFLVLVFVFVFLPD